MEENTKTKKEKKENPYWYNLVKYPIYTACIAGLLLVFDKTETISALKIDKDGLGITRLSQAVEVKMNDLDNKLGVFSEQVGSSTKKNKVGEISTSGIGGGEQPTEVKSPASSEVMNDAISELSFSNKKRTSTILKDEIGYIWIGDFDGAKTPGKWSNISIDSIKSDDAPSSISVKGYSLTKNLVLREAPPTEAGKFASGSVGIIPKGVRIKIEEPLVCLKDPNFEKYQYWAKVKVLQ